ncbi:MAG: DNA mismatch repair protein MutL, partial [Planctomycetaceae bacterium]|nr:DNA mismatch repair protein MutL [Planctomycetaceae bacterium]
DLDSGGSRGERRELQRELASWAREQLNGWQPDAAAGSRGEESEADLPVTVIEPVPYHAGDREAGGSGFDGADAAATDGAVADGVEQDGPGTTGDPGQPPADGVMIRTGGTGHESADSPARTPRVMQIHDCYLVMETDEGLTVIDQHALHERILYEQLRQRVLEGAVETQRLLLPITVELSSGEAAALTEHQDILNQLGFTIEPFGGQTVLITGYPSMLRTADHMALVRDLAERLLEAGARPGRRDILDSLLHMMSCKAAIKSGQRLSPEEMQSLLASRHMCADSHHCPHGRPTALSLTRDELDRQFGRLG